MRSIVSQRAACAAGALVLVLAGCSQDQRSATEQQRQTSPMAVYLPPAGTEGQGLGSAGLADDTQSGRTGDAISAGAHLGPAGVSTGRTSEDQRVYFPKAGTEGTGLGSSTLDDDPSADPN